MKKAGNTPPIQIKSSSPIATAFYLRLIATPSMLH